MEQIEKDARWGWWWEEVAEKGAVGEEDGIIYPSCEARKVGSVRQRMRLAMYRCHRSDSALCSPASSTNKHSHLAIKQSADDSSTKACLTACQPAQSRQSHICLTKEKEKQSSDQRPSD